MTARALAGMRVLLVEDEMLVAVMLEDILVDLGCAVIGPAGSVAKALELIEGEALDGALLDVNLNGEEVYPAAKALAARGIPFVFVTGYGDTGVDDQRYGGVPVVQKPFRPATLGRVLADRIARKEQGAA